MALVSSSTRVGPFTVQVDGAWDIQDLLALAEAFSESYGYFYALVVSDEEAAKRIHETIQKRFWSGEIETRRFGKQLYSMIPQSDALKLRSFSYASPGTITLVGLLPVLWMAAKVAKAWLSAGNDLISLWERVERFFERRSKRRKPGRRTEVDDGLRVDVDDARVLVFAVGSRLGFDDLSIERLIEISGNPIAALKLLVALGNEARKLSALEQNNLITLPAAPDGTLALGVAPTRRTRQGVPVQIRRSRTKPKPSGS